MGGGRPSHTPNIDASPLPPPPAPPQVYLALVPAATLDEARRYLTEHTPRILMFSGHTLLGALAFEKASSTPPAAACLFLASARKGGCRMHAPLLAAAGLEGANASTRSRAPLPLSLGLASRPYARRPLNPIPRRPFPPVNPRAPT
eukprot:scaffold598_cov57-Isochrysis_galbana.AAC.2